MRFVASVIFLGLASLCLARPPMNFKPGPPNFPPNFNKGKGGGKNPLVVAPIIFNDLFEDDDDMIMPVNSQSLLSMMTPTTNPTPQVIFVPQIVQAPCPQQQQQAAVQPTNSFGGAGQPRSGFPQGTLPPGTGISTGGGQIQPQQPETPTPMQDLTNIMNQLQDQQTKRLEQLEQQHHLEKIQLLAQASDQVMAKALEQAQKNQQLLQQLANQPETFQPQMNDNSMLFPDTRSGFPTGVQQMPQQQTFSTLPQSVNTGSTISNSIIPGLDNAALMSLLSGLQPQTTMQTIMPVASKKTKKKAAEKKMKSMLESLMYNVDDNYGYSRY